MTSDVEGYELGSKSIQEAECAALLSSQKSESKNKEAFPALLTREDLIRLEQTEPVWKRIRIAIFVLFWILWIGLLVSTILLVVFSHKCPNKPDLPFYKSKVGYWVDPYAFKDSDGDGIGDLPGLISKIDYIKDVMNAGYIILDSLFTGYSNSAKYLSSFSSWTTVDPMLAQDEFFGTMLKKLRRLGVDIIVAIDFNSLLSDSTLMKDLQNPTSKLPGTGLISRMGDPISGTSYSVYGSSSGLVDVDLTNSKVIDTAKAAVIEILKLGASGILLKDAAFFSEGASDYENPTKLVNGQKWFAKYQSQLMFANSSRSFVEQIKQAVEEAQSITGQQKVLIVEAGNVGFGLAQGAPDPTEMFLGEGQADMVIGRHFVRDRGWHSSTADPKVMQPSLDNYLGCTSNETRPNTFLVTATSHDAPLTSVYSTAMSFLLPGPPLLYYGSEIGSGLKTSTSPTEFYPKGKLPLCQENETCHIASHVPMPWDDQGTDFSDDPKIQQAYAKFFANSVGKFTNTVQNQVETAVTCVSLEQTHKNRRFLAILGKSYYLATLPSNYHSEPLFLGLSNLNVCKSSWLMRIYLFLQFATSNGREKDTIFDLVQRMVKVRNSEPSIQWGDDVNMVPAYKNLPGIEVFTRWGGYGQSPILTVVVKESSGLVIDLKKVNCSESKLIYSFPENQILKEGSKLGAHVFLQKLHDGQNGRDATIYLIKCPAKWE